MYIFSLRLSHNEISIYGKYARYWLKSRVYLTSCICLWLENIGCFHIKIHVAGLLTKLMPILVFYYVKELVFTEVLWKADSICYLLSVCDVT